jgi:NTP pyrophosphatase (non-canonical NTP hydrolase)
MNTLQIRVIRNDIPHEHQHIIGYDDFVDKLEKKFPKDLNLEFLHCAIGIAGEAGELADAIKKATIYGKPLDVDNVIEELGDLMWYIQATVNKLGITLNEVLEYNYTKLRVRYEGLVYSDEAAIARADKN